MPLRLTAAGELILKEGRRSHPTGPAILLTGTQDEVTAVVRQHFGREVQVLGLDEPAPAAPPARDATREQLYAAVKYVLDRSQTIPDLGYQIGPHTRIFEMLVLAEAMHLGEDPAAVEKRRGRDLQPAHDKRRPRIVELCEEREKLLRVACAALRVARSEPGWGEMEEALDAAGFAVSTGEEE
jgi:hypothetical protein